MARPLRKVDDLDSTLVDKVFEHRLAELIGTTSRALENKRLTGIIPIGVWAKVNGRIMYSLERYNEWAESQWVSQMGSKSAATQSGFASPGKDSAEAKPLPIRRPRRGLQRPVVSVLV